MHSEKNKFHPTGIIIPAVFFLLLTAGCQSLSKIPASAPSNEVSLAERLPAPSSPASNYKTRVVQNRFDISNKLIKEALALLDKNQTDKAILVFQLAAKQAPVDYRPYVYLSRIYLRANHENMAYSVLERAGRYQTDYNKVIREFYRTARYYLPPPAVDPPGPLKIALFPDNKKAAVTFNFDDGPTIVYTTALPIFEEFGFRATIPINPQYTEEVHTLYPWCGSWPQWRDAHRRGFEIANHALSHRSLINLSDAELEKEINTSHRIIAENIGQPPLSFVFPGDDYDHPSLKKVLEHHMAVRAHDYLVHNVYPRVLIPVYGGAYFSVESAELLIDLAVRRRLWLIAECHAIESFEVTTHKPISEEFLRQHLSDIKEREDDVWVDTFFNVYRYLFLRKHSLIQDAAWQDRSVRFVLASQIEDERFLSPLTIIITPQQNPLKATAVYPQTNTPLPARVKDGLILVDIVPSTRPVLVRWE